MTHPSDSTQHISLQVRDQEGTAATVRLTVDESDASGTLSNLTPAGEVSEELAFTHLRKARDGTQLTCYVSGATATLSLARDESPPEIHVSASLFLPVFEAIYRIDPADQERLMAWINTLKIGTIAAS
jgi:hypothetical protein